MMFDGWDELVIWDQPVCRLKGRKDAWLFSEWPPKKVKITIELED